jgi:hypothetical protein
MKRVEVPGIKGDFEGNRLTILNEHVFDQDLGRQDPTRIRSTSDFPLRMVVRVLQSIFVLVAVDVRVIVLRHGASRKVREYFVSIT